MCETFEYLFVADAVYGRLNVNVALNRPTFVSSFIAASLYGDYASWKANDGNGDPVSKKLGHSCIHTETQADPWWAVDLGSALSVIGVLFTNRAENWGKNSIILQRLSVALLKTTRGSSTA